MNNGIQGFQVFGMRCSGTNYVTGLLRANFPTIRDFRYSFGWKHGGIGVHWKFLKDGYSHLQDPIRKRSNVLFVIIYREPISWLQSLHRQPHHAPHCVGLDFSQFVRTAWSAYFNKDYPGQDFSDDKNVRYSIATDELLAEEFSSVFEMRSAKIERFERISRLGLNTCYINYEWLIENKMAFIEQISKFFDLEVTNFIDVKTKKFGYELHSPVDYGTILSSDLSYICKRISWYHESIIGYSVDLSELVSLAKKDGPLYPQQIVSHLRISPGIRLNRADS